MDRGVSTPVDAHGISVKQTIADAVNRNRFSWTFGMDFEQLLHDGPLLRTESPYL
jgi:hypothetical protein